MLCESYFKSASLALSDANESTTFWKSICLANVDSKQRVANPEIHQIPVVFWI